MSIIENTQMQPEHPSMPIARKLSECFENSVEIWQLTHDWVQQFTIGEAPYPSDQSDIHFYIHKSQGDAEPFLLPLDDQRTLFILPIQAETGFDTVAVGISRLSQTEMLRTLLKQEFHLQRIEERNEFQADQIDLYAAQVSADFEEMTWLRALADQLGVCTVERSLNSLAESALELLGDLIHCRTVALITPGSGTDATSELNIKTWGENIPEESCRELVAHWRNSESSVPIVCNDGLIPDSNTQCPEGINSYILTALMKDGKTYGWVATLNKKNTGHIRTHFHDQMDAASELEFGTSEATLIRSTANILASHAKNLDLFEQRQELLIGIIRTMMNSLDAKDPYTCGHSDRVAQYARIIAENMQLPVKECHDIYVTGLVHDIGKVGVPDHVLKKPGKLTDEEFAEIKKHPEIGYKILKSLDAFSYVLPGVLHHHESVDGSGYPHQLKGDAIPLMARILAVADAYDAMTSTRPYRDGMPVKKAVSILLEGAGSQWDKACVEAFFDGMPQILEITIESDQQKDHYLKQYPSRAHALQSEINSVQAAVAAATLV
ncbi:HD-GYP domain-containing protein [Rubinisphaera italica]|uniref:Cyclic di-GMP phosphodiesterase response regulator RpfG n=1 Tax=Rubinisphaera italica TaxID=2527969 RepID=A0A5C5XC98_9PLAN|nr:HD-GYP domain-containing protein [Rubinisphaera italica]TWT59923.1 Cyclic di-GMP phosphodiesterase response regulator RpfG [Rubinisphaera italica]